MELFEILDYFYTLLSNPHDANIDPKEGWAQANCQQGPEWLLYLNQSFNKKFNFFNRIQF